MKKLKLLSIILATLAFLASSIKCLGMPYGQGSASLFRCPEDGDYPDYDPYEDTTAQSQTEDAPVCPQTGATPAWSPEVNKLLLDKFHPILPNVFPKTPSMPWWKKHKDGETLMKNAICGPNGEIILNYGYYLRLYACCNQNKEDVFQYMWDEFARRTPSLYKPSKQLNIKDIILNESMYRAFLQSDIWKDYLSSARKPCLSGLSSQLLDKSLLPERLCWWFVQGFNAGRYSLGHLVMALCDLKPETPEQQPEIEHNVYVLVLLAQKMFSQ